MVPYNGSKGFLNNARGYANNQEPWLSAFDSMTVAASHELAEAVTDPDPPNGWGDGPDNAEAGDLASGSTVYLNGFAVQRISALPGSTTELVSMTPSGAVASQQVAFSLRTNGDLYEFSATHPTGVRIARSVASVSAQGIDDFGQPMVDVLFTNGVAEEYHDFLPGSTTSALRRRQF